MKVTAGSVKSQMKFIGIKMLFLFSHAVKAFRNFAIENPFITAAVAPPLYYSAFFSAAIFGCIIIHDALLIYIPMIAFIVVPLYNLFVIAIMPSQITRIKLFIFFIFQICFIFLLFFLIISLNLNSNDFGLD